MHVELLYHTPDPERAIATGGAPVLRARGRGRAHGRPCPRSACKACSPPSWAAATSPRSSTPATPSRWTACRGRSTHQLVRHRIASFNQQSQRYVRFSDGVGHGEARERRGERGGERGVRQGDRRRRRGVREAAGSGRAGRGRALPPAERGRDEDRHHHERARAAALLPPALLQPCAVGDPRHGAPDARAGAPHGAVHLPRTPAPPAWAAPAPRERWLAGTRIRG